jgi:hypothetical protein
MDDLAGMVREWQKLAASRAGLPEGKLAEGFRQIKLPD